MLSYMKDITNNIVRMHSWFLANSNIYSTVMLSEITAVIPIKSSKSSVTCAVPPVISRNFLQGSNKQKLSLQKNAHLCFSNLPQLIARLIHPTIQKYVEVGLRNKQRSDSVDA